MNRQFAMLFLFVMAVTYLDNLPIAWSQNLTKEWVEKTARPLVDKKIANGLSIGYIEGDHSRVVHLGSAGGKKIPDDQTLYEIGSVGKVFTSLMLADAAVRGEIQLDAPVDVTNKAGIRLPSYEGTRIKWIDLSTHRSGLPRIPGNLKATDLINPYRNYDSKKAAAFLNNYELTRKPGETHEYSNLGAMVLGYLVPQNSRVTYQRLLRKRIAEPLGMTDCTVFLNKQQKKRLATPHSQFGKATPAWTFADLPGAGGICATMSDMMRFAKAQLSPPKGEIGEAIELAWKQHCDADKSGPAMGLGWVIAGDGHTRWHNGQTGGSRSAVFINRKLKCAVVVLCNTSVMEGIDELAMQIVMKSSGVEAEPETADDDVPKPGDQTIDAKLRSRLVGQYQLTPNFIFTVTDDDGHLMVGITNQPTQEVFPDSATHWSYRGVKATLEFKLGKSGSARSLVLHQKGIKQTARRIKAESDDLAIDAKHRRRLVGRYKLARNFIFTVTDRNGHLMVGITKQPTQEVFPDSPTHWSYRGVKATLEFKLGKSGRAKSLILHQNGIKQTARRMK